MACDASVLLEALQAGAAETQDPDELGAHIVRAVKAALSQASWVGIYWVRGPELVLGPYEGGPTEHTRIPRGRGICGQALNADQDLLVPDVREAPDYLACSPTVRSELVVLIRSQGRVVGQLDLDADEVGAFDEDDHCVLRAVADGFGALIDTTMPPAARKSPDGD